MTLKSARSGWSGDEADLDDYLARYARPTGRLVSRVLHARCATCASPTFTVRVDEYEGCASRRCTGCDEQTWMFDSERYCETAALGDAQCACGNKTFNVAAGFTLGGGGDVTWVYVGLRCTQDGVLACTTDWPIEYSPSEHLLLMA